MLRIIGIDREEYREQVITHMNALITQAPGTEINLDQVYIHYQTWATYAQYPKCLAFVDMYGIHSVQDEGLLCAGSDVFYIENVREVYRGIRTMDLD